MGTIGVLTVRDRYYIQVDLPVSSSRLNVVVYRAWQIGLL